MTTTTWALLILGVLILFALVVLIVRVPGTSIGDRFKSVWNNQVGRHVIAIVTLIVFLQVVNAIARYTADDKAGDWLTQYNGRVTTAAVGAIDADADADVPPSSSAATSSSPAPSPLPSPSPSPSPSPVVQSAAASNAGNTDASGGSPTPTPTPTEGENARLKAQLQIIRDRSRHHGNVEAYFYVNYFVSIVMVMTAGLIAAISLFFIAQAGWNTANSYVRAAFIVASSYAAFYGLFPPVLQEQKNITDNKELFLRYKSLENEVISYPLTLLTLNGEPATPKQFINHVDAEMDRLGDIALGFDISKVSYEEAFERAARPSPTPNAAAHPETSPKK